MLPLSYLTRVFCNQEANLRIFFKVRSEPLANGIVGAEIARVFKKLCEVYLRVVLFGDFGTREKISWKTFGICGKF